MEEIIKFLSLLKKYRIILIIIPVITLIITYFLVRNLPDSYMSQAQISTGIVDDTKQNLLAQSSPQAQQVAQEFSNLMSMIRMKRILDQISYQLVIHDLTSSKPFRKLSSQITTLSTEQKKHDVAAYLTMYNKQLSLNLYNSKEKILYDQIRSMQYDSDNITNKLMVYRSGDSDFIVVQFESENPELSAFVSNTLAAEFVKYYSTQVRANQVKTTNFLSNLLNKKSDTLSKRMEELRNYKIRNRVLNLDEQSKQLYTRIMDYEEKKQEATQNTSSYAGALNEIDNKFSPVDRKYIEATLSKVNQKIVNTKDELSALYDLYYKNDLDERYKQSIDSLQQKLGEQINKSADQYIVSPLSTKQALVEEKLGLEVKLDISRYSINSLERELKKLNGQFDQLVPREAEVQSFEMKLDIATKEYLDVLNKYNQSSLESDFEVKLNVVQAAMPGVAQPSKKMLLVILSGIISLVFCVLVIFVLYYLNNNIITAKDLANTSQSPVLGSLNYISTGKVDLYRIWKDDNTSKAEREFKNALRSIRYEIENDVKGKVIAVTSLGAKEGKSLFSISLAFAWKMTNHKVLVIDGNFNSPHLTPLSKTSPYLEDFLRDGSVMNTDAQTSIGFASFLPNKGGDTSIMELAGQDIIKDRLDWARTKFDIIIIETAPLDGINQSKEWFTFCDGIIGVFKSGLAINSQKKINIDYLRATGLFKGWILNMTPSDLE
ncbi:lipopolysaccharide biosynthesis protein [Pedobacter sp. MC2016-24]|uniref:exopolysaccharide transport family protein n=1 Tax=Pedobacter sp. MC2016-24 TaxID=2780090 RepID=UPI001881D9C0|nr:lipopolysaccharide biosynthesis protein [Pedobacter sp. MC2016-24]MBE9602482.1 lipopolysaccharide biosynthesis protein [Pedobacter sp. MC2016-24]